MTLTSGPFRYEPAPSAGDLRLGALPRGARGIITGIATGADVRNSAINGAELERRLLEMGFVEGATFHILHEGPVGRDPIALRLDDTRIALRRRDAMALLVALDPA